MSLTGVELPASTLGNIEPNTVLVVISDEKGKARVAKVDYQSIAKSEPFLKITAGSSPDTAQAQGGCWKRINGQLVWVNPCV
ncbi:MAG: hypothetical protein P9F75_19980 [Candidatus Contendobacter sp.]|nr:hypothetical protein [Candidatus Contendobacter sp.]